MQVKNAIRLMLFALGFLSIGTQIYLVREFLNVFNGNELIFGIVLAFWMLLTGTGAFIGRFSHRLQSQTGFVIILAIIAGVLPVLMLTGLSLVKFLMDPLGSMASLWTIIVAASVLQVPFCLISGFLFSFLSVMNRDRGLAGAYAWESLGSMASGALINLVFLWVFSSFLSLLILTGCYFIFLLIFIWFVKGRALFYFGICVTAAVFASFYWINPGSVSEEMLYRDQHVISNMGTPYGQVVITQNQEQFNFYENGLLLFSSGNEISNEENVHYAMVQHVQPWHVLLISGGYSGTLEEILKYDPVLIDYVEMNPALIRIASGFTKQLNHAAIQVHETDARKFIRKTTSSYDVVLVNLPAPSTLQLNRFYTVEFLHWMKQKMNPGGIIAYSLPTGSDYISDVASQMNTTLYQTLKQRFNHVLVIPATRNYFLASDSALNIDIPGLIDTRGIATVYVNRYYLDIRQLRERSMNLTSNMNFNIRPGSTNAWPGSTNSRQVLPSLRGSEILTGWINRDFYPVALFYQHVWWLGYFSFNPLAIMIVFLVILLIILGSLNANSAGLFTGGFTLASSEIILIFALQVIYGYVFQAIGVVIMVYMIGLAAGAGFGRVNFHRKHTISYFLLQISLAVYSVVLPWLIIWLSGAFFNDIIVQVTLAFFAFVGAFIVGMEYRVSSVMTKLSPGKTVANNYAADLFGSAMGALVVTVLLLPLAGIIYTGIFLAGLNIISAVILIMRHRETVSL